MRLFSTLTLSLLIAGSLSLSACDKKTDSEKAAEAVEQAQGLSVKSGKDEVNMKDGKLEVKSGDEKVEVKAGDGKLKVEGAFGKLNIDTKNGTLNIQATEKEEGKEGDADKKDEAKKE